MRIVIEPVSVDSGGSRLVDVASELAQLESRLRSTVLAPMPGHTAGQVSAAINGAAATLRSLVIDYVSIGQELRVRSAAIQNDALSWLRPVGLPEWFAQWFVNEIVRKGVAPFSAAFLRDVTIGRVSHVLMKHPEDVLRWFTNIDPAIAGRGAALDRASRWLNVLADPLERAVQRGHVAGLIEELETLQALRTKWLGRIQGLGKVGMGYGLVTHAMHSEANTTWGKGVSTGLSYLFTKTPPGTSLDIATGGGLSTSADFYAITAETIVDPDLENYRSWTEANLRGDNGYVFRIAAQIPENGEYLADYTYDKWTWFPVDEETGETRFEWRPWKWDDPPED